VGALRILNDFVNPFLKIFDSPNFSYLEAVRGNTQRLYTWQSQGTGFNKIIMNFVKTNQPWQFEFINLWLNEFGIAKELKIDISEHGIGASLSVDGTPLADLGYGVTQFLPILMKLVTCSERHWVPFAPGFEFASQILYIEEPETNLHPKLQSKLADMLIDATKKFNLQIIVETHSEYLIRKLQYLTAKKDITPETTVIHYFYDPKEARPEGVPQVKQIDIREDGRLSGEFGAGFYDETARLMTAILTGENLN
jgi:predicted ATPase